LPKQRHGEWIETPNLPIERQTLYHGANLQTNAIGSALTYTHVIVGAHALYVKCGSSAHLTKVSFEDSKM